MAYNFQQDFIEALTKDLTEGNLGGAEDFANAVTKYYMNTVKKGLPQGVPTTLPAPGLNPTAPPPFVIGTSGVKPNQAKQKIFYETVKAYFLAKELSLDKGSIKGLKDSIEQTVNKLKLKKAEIQDLVTKTKALAVEIKNVPVYILETIEGAKEIIQEEKDKVKNIGNLFGNLKEELKRQGIDEAKFKSMFSQELSLIDQVQNFTITSFQDFTALPDKIRTIKGTVSNIKSSAGIVTPLINSPADLERARAAKQNYSAFDQNKPAEATASGSADIGQFAGDSVTNQIRKAQYAQQDKINALKFYAANRIGESASSIEQLSLIVVDPPRFIEYLRRLARKNPKVNRLYQAITKLDAIERFVKPELKKLEIQIEIKKKEIKDYIQPRIDALKQKLEDRVTEYLEKKKAGAKLRLYSKAKKRVDEFRKTHEERIRLKKEEMQMIQKAIKKAYSLVQKSTVLQKQILLEFETIKTELITLKDRVQSGAIVSDYLKLGKDIKAGLANIQVSKLANTGSLSAVTPPNPLEAPSLRTTNPSLFVEGYDRQINSVADLERTRDLRKQTIANQQSSAPTREEVYTYMNQLGLGDFAAPVVTLLAEVGTDLNSFKRLFELRRENYKALFDSIKSLLIEVEELLSLLQDISESKGPVGKKIAWTKDKLGNLGEKMKYTAINRYATVIKISMQDLLNEIVRKVDPLIKKATVWASRLFKKAKTFVEEKISKFEKDIETFLINLIPLKGYQKKKLEDAENRKMMIDAKKQRLEEFKNTVEYYQKLGTEIGKMARGSQGLFTNLFQNKEFSYAKNQSHIKNIADGLYGFKIVEAKGNAGVISGLKQDKEVFTSQMKTIGVVDAMIRGLIVLFKELISTPAGKLFLEEVKKFGETLSRTGSQYAVLWNEFTKIFASPPTTAAAIKAFVDDTLTSDGITKMLESSEVVTFLIEKEKKYLGRVRETLKTVMDAPLKDKYTTKKGFERLVELNTSLNRHESFIKNLMLQLKKAIDEFVRFIRSEVEVFIEKQKKKIQEKFEKKKATLELELEKIKERAVNVDAKVMSIAMGLAARLYWTGATWQGNTGTNHLVLNIGPFEPLTALPEDGMSGLVESLSKSFENQLTAMTGLIIPPANTGIVPIPFQGYK